MEPPIPILAGCCSVQRLDAGPPGQQPHEPELHGPEQRGPAPVKVTTAPVQSARRRASEQAQRPRAVERMQRPRASEPARRRASEQEQQERPPPASGTAA